MPRYAIAHAAQIVQTIADSRAEHLSMRTDGGQLERMDMHSIRSVSMHVGADVHRLRAITGIMSNRVGISSLAHEHASHRPR